MAGGRKDQCGTCQANLTKTQASVQCKVCHLWFHVSCQNITAEELKALRDFKHLSYICTSCEENPPTVDERSLKDEITVLNGKFDDFMRKGDEERSSIKQAFADVVGDLKRELSSCMKEVKSDIVDCSNLIRHVESSTSVQISKLETENNALHRRLNRTDLIISGLPVGLSNLTAPIIELGSLYNVPVNLHDINHVCYISNKKSLLVKFNSVLVRDEIMKRYFKAIKIRSPLVVSDLIKLDENNSPSNINGANVHNVTNGQEEINTLNGTNSLLIAKRVFINAHHSPAAGKLNAICRRLLKDKIITKFKVLDADKPKAKLTMQDGKDVVVDTIGCAALLNNGVSV